MFSFFRQVRFLLEALPGAQHRHGVSKYWRHYFVLPDNKIISVASHDGYLRNRAKQLKINLKDDVILQILERGWIRISVFKSNIGVDTLRFDTDHMARVQLALMDLGIKRGFVSWQGTKDDKSIGVEVDDLLNANKVQELR